MSFTVDDFSFQIEAAPTTTAQFDIHTTESFLSAQGPNNEGVFQEVAAATGVNKLQSLREGAAAFGRTNPIAGTSATSHFDAKVIKPGLGG